ncbi:MAG: Fe-Mn family superoxide dismutase [Candidatus Paceibacterota bacterium]|jgi:Fe-Mn family superoxide dismutase
MYQEKSFTIPSATGISEETLTTHLKLYDAYVKNTNAVQATITEAEKDTTKNSSILAGLYRRISFEWNGMRNHEYFFTQFESGSHTLTESALKQSIEKTFGSFEQWLLVFKALASTRGIGWAVLYKDTLTGELFNSWIDEQQLGVYTGATPILMLDMWEHAFILDYAPAEKSKYIDALFANLNWSICEKRFSGAQ